MKKKRNLSKELNVNVCVESTYNALDISIDRIKYMVNDKIVSASAERKTITMKSKKKIALIAVAATLVMGITAFAASHLLNAKEVANTLGDTKLAQNFNEQNMMSDTIVDGEYKATVLGITSGENLSDFESSAREIFSERTYAVVAVEKTNGTSMTFDDEILVTPLIEGLKPWQYNIFTMNGSYTADIIDGVLYRIIEFDSIEYFADKNVYMAVLSEPFLDNTAYSFDDVTGTIAPKEDYEGTNILIDLELDKSKANPEKAAEYLDELNKKAKGTDEPLEINEYIIAPDTDREVAEFVVDAQE